MARTLALDVGDRRIGVAVSDVTKLIARPLCVIDRKHEDAIARVVALIVEHGADEVVVGLPLHANGSAGEQARQVQAFVEALRVHLEVPIRWVDERYTTQDAKHILAEVRRRKQPDYDDAIAAAVILQRYLDEWVRGEG
ncbi:MAG: Holliday junction resolvase RuvX [Anaerolineae bacterium]|nr:Holliday junction resolvase RuvX [Candidatus Roseilinea sp.]MDW8448881.1 Holliday junction resolvase RuvX [Anaerolineae bacterium]